MTTIPSRPESWNTVLKSLWALWDWLVALVPSIRRPEYSIDVMVDYNASGSGATTTTVGSTAPGGTATLANASSFKANHGIYIAGAGASGAAYIGIVTADPVGNVILISPATSTTVPNGTLVQHDDTVALNAALAAAPGKKVFMPNGYYRANAPFGAQNGILELPQNSSSNPPKTIKILGEQVEVTSANVPGTSGVWIDATQRSLLGSGTRPSVFSGKAYGSTGSLSNFNYISLEMENIAFRIAPNPTISVVQLHNIIESRLKNIYIFDGELPSVGTVTEPTTATAAGIIMPGVNNHAKNSLESIGIFAMYQGVCASEHTHFIGDIYASFCKVGLELESGINGHLNWGKFGSEFCTTMLKISGGGKIALAMVLTGESDRSTGTWTQTTYDLDDPSNLGVGSLNYEITTSGIGYVPLLRRGGAAITVMDWTNGKIESNLNLQELSNYWQNYGTLLRLFDTFAGGSVVTMQGIPDGAGKYDLHLMANLWYEGGYHVANTARPQWDMYFSIALDQFAIRRSPAGATFVPVDFMTISSAGVVSFPLSSFGLTQGQVLKMASLRG